MSKLLARLCALALSVLLALPVWAQEPFAAKVIGVTDGQTLTVLTEARRRVKLRLHGIDAPESHQDYGTCGKQFASDQEFGKTIMAWWYRQYAPNDRTLQALEEEARLWADRSPIPPWEFRRNGRGLMSDN